MTHGFLVDFFLSHDHAGRLDRQESFQTWHGDYRDLVTWYQVVGLLGSQVGWPWGKNPKRKHSKSFMIEKDGPAMSCIFF